MSFAHIDERCSGVMSEEGCSLCSKRQHICVNKSLWRGAFIFRGFQSQEFTRILPTLAKISKLSLWEFSVCSVRRYVPMSKKEQLVGGSKLCGNHKELGDWWSF